MKIRNGFVSNSSSSSFLIGIDRDRVAETKLLKKIFRLSKVDDKMIKEWEEDERDIPKFKESKDYYTFWLEYGATEDIDPTSWKLDYIDVTEEY